MSNGDVVAHVSRWRVVPFGREHARELATWRYPQQYARYDGDGAADELLSNGYVALVDEHGRLVGFRSFGLDGRVPGYDYDDAALDTGGGLRPDLTGRGLGRAAIALGLDHGRRTFAPDAFRVTVWSANERALRVVRSLGFDAVAEFAATTDGERYEVLVRVECGTRDGAV